MLENRIEIMSKKDIKQLIEGGFLENTAVICFHTPVSKTTCIEYSPVDFQGKCERAFVISIYDIDIECLPEYNLNYDTYFPEAKELAKYIIRCIKDGYKIICQCQYGQSRSAGCAAAIKEFYDKNGIEIFADYRYYPNQLIFNKLLAALKEVSSDN